MSALSKPAKFVLIGSGVLLVLAILVLVASRPSRQGWTCEWLDAPTIHQGTVRNQCSGVVHCRHDTMRTFVPQVRRVSCTTSGDICDPAVCFAQSLRTP